MNRNNLQLAQCFLFGKLNGSEPKYEHENQTNLSLSRRHTSHHAPARSTARNRLQPAIPWKPELTSFNEPRSNRSFASAGQELANFGRRRSRQHVESIRRLLDHFDMNFRSL